MRLNVQVRLYPNQTMKTVLDSLCDYRRYCWNQGLELWNTMYDVRLIGLPVELRAKIKASHTDKTIEFSEEEQTLRALFPAPDERKVRNELVAQKADWQFEFSARVLQQAIKDLATAWNLFFKNPKTAGKPGFQSRKKPKQGFKTDSARIKNGRLVLDKPHAYKGEWMGIRFKGANNRNSKGYQTTRAKLQATYERIRNVQNDLLHKFTTDLYRENDTVVIEDLDVKGMQMKKKAKNLHRSLFGRFHQFMEYKAEKFGKMLIIADRFYPSTQRCSHCGHIKTDDERITLSGNQKHGTKHNEYVCYHCGYEDDRDHNAVLNLLALTK